MKLYYIKISDILESKADETFESANKKLIYRIRIILEGKQEKSFLRNPQNKEDYTFSIDD